MSTARLNHPPGQTDQYLSNWIVGGEAAMFRQGDILIVPIASMPSGLTAIDCDKGRVVLAYGEATGHTHAINDRRAALFRDSELEVMFLRVSGAGSVALEHQEHDTIHIPPGDYRVIRQREYSPEAVHVVCD